MKTWKLVSGILSIVLFIMVAFQSCAVGIGNTLGETGEVGGSAGIIVAIMLWYLISWICMITRTWMKLPLQGNVMIWGIRPNGEILLSGGPLTGSCRILFTVESCHGTG